jgi:hypothetical protein
LAQLAVSGLPRSMVATALLNVAQEFATDAGKDLEDFAKRD